MAKKKTSAMTYLGGHSGRKGLLGVLAFPEDYPADTEFTVFYTMLDDQWWQQQFKFDIASVAYLADARHNTRAWWLAGKRGEIVEFSGGTPRVEKIATAGTGPGDKYGYLSQIRVIDGELFVCGYRRQVYRQQDGGWELISRDILDNRKKGPWNGFEAIDGHSRNDLYAVGDEGEIWHFNGSEWQRCDSPTNQNLADVRCCDGKVWVCGDGGIILCGDRNGWEILWSTPDPAEQWWGIDCFMDETYVAGSLFLGKLQDGEIVAVDTGVQGTITAQTLQVKDGILWSIGARHILSFDGKRWTQHVCPENR